MRILQPINQSNAFELLFLSRLQVQTRNERTQNSLQTVRTPNNCTLSFDTIWMKKKTKERRMKQENKEKRKKDRWMKKKTKEEERKTEESRWIISDDFPGSGCWLNRFLVISMKEVQTFFCICLEKRENLLILISQFFFLPSAKQNHLREKGLEFIHPSSSSN